MKQYKFFKHGSSGGYRFEPEKGNAGSYTVDVNQRPIGENPFIFLSQDSKTQPDHKNVVLAAGRLATSSSFKIYLGDPKCYYEEYDKSLPWEKMNIERPESTWSLEFPDSDLRRDFIWKKTRRVAVDGVEKPSRLLAQNWKLTCANDPDDVLAIFTGDLGLSRGGILQVNVDWGVQFEHMFRASNHVMGDVERDDLGTASVYSNVPNGSWKNTHLTQQIYKGDLNYGLDGFRDLHLGYFASRTAPEDQVAP